MSIKAQNPKANPHICLTMIVKNEAHIIERCLNSVIPLISYWLIVDTGSTDGTQEIIRRTMFGINGELHERPWRNFAFNRNEAFALAQGKADYCLVIDADDFIEQVEPLPLLTADAYLLTIQYDDCSYQRLQLFKNNLPWQYVGVLHEYPMCDLPNTQTHLSALIYHVQGCQGGRSQDPQKYLKDAAVLESALIDEPDNDRYQFYLAQSYRDAGQLERAIMHYQKRIVMGRWEEEVYYCLLQIAVLSERLNYPQAQVWAAYLNTYQYRPQRAESLCELARYCRQFGGNYHLAYQFAAIAKDILLPSDRLFIDRSVYEWKALDEYAVAASWTGRDSEAISIYLKLLAEKRLPELELPRVKENLAFLLNRALSQS